MIEDIRDTCPIGTAIGIYTIWVLIQPGASQFLESDYET